MDENNMEFLNEAAELSDNWKTNEFCCCWQKEEFIEVNKCNIYNSKDVEYKEIKIDKIKCSGKMIAVKVSLKNLCPGRKLAVGVSLEEIGYGPAGSDNTLNQGNYDNKIKCFKVKEVEVPSGWSGGNCKELSVLFCFVFEDKDACSKDRKFKAKAFANYIDAEIPDFGCPNVY